MDKIEYRAVMEFFGKEALTPNEMHSKFIKVYGDSSPSSEVAFCSVFIPPTLTWALRYLPISGPTG